MISGTLILGKDESYSTLIRKRIFRFIAVILIFEGGLYLKSGLISAIKGGTPDWNPGGFLRGVLAGKIDGAGSYWYLYAYLGMLLMLPFLRKIAKSIGKKDIALLVVLHFLLSSFLPLLNTLLNIFHMAVISLESHFSVPLAVEKAFFYPLLGYYLDRYIDVSKFRLKEIAGLSATAFTGILISSICTYYEGETTGTYTQNYVQLFDYVTTIVAFLLIKYLFVVRMKKINDTAKKIITTAGSLTFGIYLLDPYLKSLFYSAIAESLEPLLPTIFVSGAWCLVSMLVGGITTFIIKKVPYVGKLI